MFAASSFSSSYSVDQYFTMLNKKRVEILNVSPGSIKTILKNHRLFLEVEGQKNDLFPVSRVFVEKLFRWFYTSTEMLPSLSHESILSITNDLLSTINKRGAKYPVNRVQLRIEDGVALSILGDNYVSVEDQELYEHLKEFEIKKIVHDDHITRFLTNIIIQREAVVGDKMGYAMHFTNSQTGFGAMTRAIYILRYWCTNGAVKSEFVGKEYYYHNGGGLQGFIKSLSSFSEEFDGQVSKFELNLNNARNIKHNKKFNPRIKNIISTALSAYQTKEMMQLIEKCDTIWQIYDTLTTRAKSFGTFQRFLLEEAAGSVISNFGKTEMSQNP